MTDKEVIWRGILDHTYGKLESQCLGVGSLEGASMTPLVEGY